MREFREEWAASSWGEKLQIIAIAVTLLVLPVAGIVMVVIGR